MFCTKCGASLGDDAKFCTKCGNPVKAEAEEAITAVEEPLEEPAEEAVEEVPEEAVEEVVEDTIEPIEEIAEEAEPVVEEAEPVVEETEPVVEEAEPVVEETEPVVEEAEPVVETPVEVKPEKKTRVKPARKGVYIKKHARSSIKALAIMTKVLCVLCALLVVFGTYEALNTSIFKLPVFELTSSLLGQNNPVSELEDFLYEENVVEEMEDYLYSYGDVLMRDDKNALKKFIGACEDFLDNPTIGETKIFYNSVIDIVEDDLGIAKEDIGDELREIIEYEDIDISLTSGDIATIEEVFVEDGNPFEKIDLVFICAWSFAALIVILLLVSGFTNLASPAVVALILEAIVALAFIGFMYLAVFTAVTVIMIILINVINASYKNYKNKIKYSLN